MRKRNIFMDRRRKPIPRVGNTKMEGKSLPAWVKSDPRAPVRRHELLNVLSIHSSIINAQRPTAKIWWWFYSNFVPKGIRERQVAEKAAAEFKGEKPEE